jgi:uncharacterized protein (DUF433 family)
VKTLQPLPTDDHRVAWPLYTIREAARYLDLKPSTLHHWVRPARDEPLVTTLPGSGRQPTVPFIGLTEAFVIAAAKAAGVPDYRIRPGVEAIKREAGGLDHALASRLVSTDGAEIFYDQLDDEDLTVARTTQRAFRKAVESHLKLIEFEQGDAYAQRLRLPQFRHAEVMIDPHVASGRPLLRRGVGVRVKDLVDRVQAGDQEDDVARDFGVTLEELQEVVGNT